MGPFLILWPGRKDADLGLRSIRGRWLRSSCSSFSQGSEACLENSLESEVATGVLEQGRLS